MVYFVSFCFALIFSLFFPQTSPSHVYSTAALVACQQIVTLPLSAALPAGTTNHQIISSNGSNGTFVIGGATTATTAGTLLQVPAPVSASIVHQRQHYAATSNSHTNYAAAMTASTANSSAPPFAPGTLHVC